MSINKINYEQFALDYLEGNLSGDALREMELFLAENADIKKELEELELFYLEEENIIYSDKENLLKEAVIIPLGTKNNSLVTKRILGIAATLLLFVILSVLFIFNHNDLNEGNNIVNTTNQKIKEIIQQNNNPIIIPDKNESIISEDEKLNLIVEEEIMDNKNESIRKQKSNNTGEEKRKNNFSQNPIANLNSNNYSNLNGNNSTKINEEEKVVLETVVTDYNLATINEPITIVRINPIINNTILALELSKEKLTKINVISPYEDIENHSRKGILAKMENAGLIPERQPRGGKIRDAFVPEYFSSKN